MLLTLLGASAVALISACFHERDLSRVCKEIAEMCRCGDTRDLIRATSDSCIDPPFIPWLVAAEAKQFLMTNPQEHKDRLRASPDPITRRSAVLDLSPCFLPRFGPNLRKGALSPRSQFLASIARESAEESFS